MDALRSPVSCLHAAALVYVCLLAASSASATRPQETCPPMSAGTDLPYRACRARNFEQAALDALDRGDLRAWQFNEIGAAQMGMTEASLRLCTAWRTGVITLPDRRVEASSLHQQTVEATQNCRSMNTLVLRAGALPANTIRPVPASAPQATPAPVQQPPAAIDLPTAQKELLAEYQAWWKVHGKDSDSIQRNIDECEQHPERAGTLRCSYDNYVDAVHSGQFGDLRSTIWLCDNHAHVQMYPGYADCQSVARQAQTFLSQEARKRNITNSFSGLALESFVNVAREVESERSAIAKAQAEEDARKKEQQENAEEESRRKQYEALMAPMRVKGARPDAAQVQILYRYYASNPRLIASARAEADVRDCGDSNSNACQTAKYHQTSTNLTNAFTNLIGAMADDPNDVVKRNAMTTIVRMSDADGSVIAHIRVRQAHEDTSVPWSMRMDKLDGLWKVTDLTCEVPLALRAGQCN